MPLQCSRACRTTSWWWLAWERQRVEDPVSNDVHLGLAPASPEELRDRLLRVSTRGEVHNALAVLKTLEALALIDQFPEMIYVKDRRCRLVSASARTSQPTGLAAHAP